MCESKKKKFVEKKGVAKNPYRVKSASEISNASSQFKISSKKKRSLDKYDSIQRNSAGKVKIINFKI